MAFKRFKKSSRKSYRKKTYKRKASRKVSPLKKVIRREMARVIETKSKQAYNLNKPLYPTNSTNFIDNIFEVGPDGSTMQITQGAGQGQRVGNEVRTKKLTLKGTIVPLPYNVTTNYAPLPMQIKMFFFYDKTDPIAVPYPVTDFYQDGSSSRGFSNDLVDQWAAVNKDKYCLFTTRQYKLGFAAVMGTGTTPAQQAYSNNDFSYNANFNIDLTKYFPKRVKFNDNLGTPTTRGLYVMTVISSADGTNIPAGWVTAAMQYEVDYQYEDA